MNEVDTLRAQVLERYTSIYAFCRAHPELKRATVYLVLSGRYPGKWSFQAARIRAALTGAEKAPETPAPSAAPTASPADDLPLPGASGDFPVDTVTTEAPVYTPDGLTLLPNGSIFLGSGGNGQALTMTVTQDGVGYTRRPSLWVNTVGSPVMSLRELAACIDDWQLDVSESGVWVLSAAGYTVVIRETDSGLSVMVDGSAIAMESGAVRLDNGEVYISDMFLRTALRATTIYDSDEQSLILFVRNKSVSTSAD